MITYFGTLYFLTFARASSSTPDATAVPGGIKVPNTGIPTTIPELFQFALKYLTALAYPLAFAAILYTAYLLIMSGGKPDGFATVKKNIVFVTTGLFLIIFAVIICKVR